MSGNAIYLATIWAIPVIIAIPFHEAAYGFVAHPFLAMTPHGGSDVLAALAFHLVGYLPVTAARWLADSSRRPRDDRPTPI